VTLFGLLYRPIFGSPDLLVSFGRVDWPFVAAVGWRDRWHVARHDRYSLVEKLLGVASGEAEFWYSILSKMRRFPSVDIRVIQLGIGPQLSNCLAEIGSLFTERRRQIDLVVLLVNKYLANLFGHGKFANGFTLPNPFPIITDGFVLVFQVKA
jgi:hypothetical protein